MAYPHRAANGHSAIERPAIDDQHLGAFFPRGCALGPNDGSDAKDKLFKRVHGEFMKSRGDRRKGRDNASATGTT